MHRIAEAGNGFPENSGGKFLAFWLGGGVVHRIQGLQIPCPRRILAYTAVPERFSFRFAVVDPVVEAPARQKALRALPDVLTADAGLQGKALEIKLVVVESEASDALVHAHSVRIPVRWLM